MSAHENMPAISLSNTYLQVSKKFLIAGQPSDEVPEYFDPKKQRQVSPERLHEILTLGSQAIFRVMDEYHDKQVSNNPDTMVFYPWINTIRLCDIGREPEVLSKIGLTEPYKEISSTEHYRVDHLQLPYHPFYEAAVGSEFEARVLSHQDGWGKKDRVHNGTWIQIHKPE